jgi:hypothetical protein
MDTKMCVFVMQIVLLSESLTLVAMTSVIASYNEGQPDSCPGNQPKKDTRLLLEHMEIWCY